MMNIVCAWCQKYLRQEPGPEGATSHGICKKCKEQQLIQFKQFMADGGYDALAPN